MIHQISLNDCLDGTVPPEQVLTISALDDVVFVRICKADEDAHSEKHTEIADISVSLASLLEAVQLLARDVDREHLRPVDHTGQGHETRLAGDRLTFVQTGSTSAVGARTTHLRNTPLPSAGRAQTPEADDA
jgi:hypothetical protein